MNFCYCLGGTGARVAEVAAHLCAMNLVDSQDITFIMVDKDMTCGTTEQARRVIKQIDVLADDYNYHTGLRRSTVIDPACKKQFFKPRLRVENWDFSNALMSVAPSDGDLAVGLEDFLSTARTDKCIFDAVFSEAEQNRDLIGGFFGRPSISDAIFKYMIKAGGWNDADRLYEEDIAYPVKSFLAANLNEPAKVFIIGSMFGGTGASILPLLADHIRNSIPEYLRNQVFISGMLMLPYFTVSTAYGNIIDPREFLAKSKAALYHYASDPAFMKNKWHPEGTFDSIYFCGQVPLHTTSEDYAEGGMNQINHFNFVDLAAAKAMTEFFAANTTEQLKAITGGQIYEYRFSATPDGELPFVDFRNTFGMQKELTAMLTFCSFFLTRVYGPLVLEGDEPDNVFMVKCLYGNDTTERRSLFRRVPTQEYVEQIKPALNTVADLVYGYCRSYIRFIKDIARNGYDYSVLGMNDYGRMYNFFNPGYIEDLESVCKSFDIENIHAAINGLNNLLRRNDYLPDFNAGITPKDIDNHLMVVFDGKAEEYKRNDVAPELRISDYLHEAYKFCYSRV